MGKWSRIKQVVGLTIGTVLVMSMVLLLQNSTNFQRRRLLIKEPDLPIINNSPDTGEDSSIVNIARRVRRLFSLHDNSANIPHVIHQIWDTDMVPDHFEDWIKTWSKLHPDWDYWFWTHEDTRRLIEIVNPSFIPAYDAFEQGQYRADVARFYIMYYFGGLYADLDVEALRPMDNWTYNHHCILPLETFAHPFLVNNYTHPVTMITLIACRSGHPYFKMALDYMCLYTKGGLTQKLIYVDDIHQIYIRNKHLNSIPSNKVYLAHPKYFLPTFDPGQYVAIMERCNSLEDNPYASKQQKDACRELSENNGWDNKPKAVSYTNHHWVHVIIDQKQWKQRDSVPIKHIMPQVVPAKSVLNILERETTHLKEQGPTAR